MRISFSVQTCRYTAPHGCRWRSAAPAWRQNGDSSAVFQNTETYPRPSCFSRQTGAAGPVKGRARRADLISQKQVTVIPPQPFHIWRLFRQPLSQVSFSDHLHGAAECQRSLRRPIQQGGQFFQAVRAVNQSSLNMILYTPLAPCDSALFQLKIWPRGFSLCT